jgi:hypothetical protein
MAFEWVQNLCGGRDVVLKMQMIASGTIAAGDALEFASGKLQRCNAAADRPRYVALEDATSTATELKKISVIPTFGNVFKVGFTPLVNDLAGESNAVTTTVKVALADGAENDLVGGYVYVKQLDEQRLITANTYSSNIVTITVAEGFSVAPTTTHSIRVVPFGPGTAALKLHASTMYNTISAAIADVTGGKVSVLEVDMKRKAAKIEFLLA